MDESTILTMFHSVMSGEWIVASPEMTIPSIVLDDSVEWSTAILSDSFNPYLSHGQAEANMYLGQQNSPDKLVTFIRPQNSELRIEIYETLQDYIVTFRPPNNDTFVLENRTNVIRMIDAYMPQILSQDAQSALSHAIDIALRKGSVQELQGSQPVLLSALEGSSVVYNHWFDSANIIWYAESAYVGFYKISSDLAAFKFKPGLDWFPDSMRNELGCTRSR